MDTTKQLINVVLELSLARQNRLRKLLPMLKRAKAANQDTSALELKDTISKARIARLIKERKALSVQLLQEKNTQAAKQRFRPSKSWDRWKCSRRMADLPRSRETQGADS